MGGGVQPLMKFIFGCHKCSSTITADTFNHLAFLQGIMKYFVTYVMSSISFKVRGCPEMTSHF